MNETFYGNDLALPVVESNLQQSPEVFEAVAQATGYLPRVQLLQGLSELCQSGKAASGNWVFVQSKETFSVLGKEFEAIVLAWRSKALSTSKPIVTSYNHLDPTFKAIVERAKQPNSGAMHGPEFLIYIPQLGEDVYATYHASSTSARMSSKQFMPQPGQALCVTFGAEWIDNGKNKWWGPKAVELTTPLELPTDREKMTEMIRSFLNPAESKVEIASGDAGRAR